MNEMKVRRVSTDRGNDYEIKFLGYTHHCMRVAPGKWQLHEQLDDKGTVGVSERVAQVKEWKEYLAGKAKHCSQPPTQNEAVGEWRTDAAALLALVATSGDERVEVSWIMDCLDKCGYLDENGEIDVEAAWKQVDALYYAGVWKQADGAN